MCVVIANPTVPESNW